MFLICLLSHCVTMLRDLALPAYGEHTCLSVDLLINQSWKVFKFCSILNFELVVLVCLCQVLHLFYVIISVVVTMANLHFHHFGHSFVSRAFDLCKREKVSVNQLLDIPASSNVFLDGYSGLNFDKVFGNPEKYLHNLKCRRVDILIIDLGTNDLCGESQTPSVVVNKALQFLDLLSEHSVNPKHVIFLSVIQRTLITRSNQVSLNTFNKRAKKYNKQLDIKLKHRASNLHVFAQSGINYPKYISDGCHLNSDGLKLYCKQLKQIVNHYSQLC